MGSSNSFPYRKRSPLVGERGMAGEQEGDLSQSLTELLLLVLGTQSVQGLGGYRVWLNAVWKDPDRSRGAS